jgi:Domain of unknown function (DUF397)
MPGTIVTTTEWLRSSYCADAACVEVAMADDEVLVRDSKNPDQALQFSRTEWSGFQDGIVNGEFDM